MLGILGTLGILRGPGFFIEGALLFVSRMESRMPGRLVGCGGSKSGTVVGFAGWGAATISGIAWVECARNESAVSHT